MNGDETLSLASRQFEAGKIDDGNTFTRGKFGYFFVSKLGVASVEIVEKMVAALEENET